MFIELIDLLSEYDFDESANVWRLDSGGVFVGEIDFETEATWLGTVKSVVEELSRYDYEAE